MIFKLLLAGDGGQGIQLIADLIAAAATKKGLYVTLIPNFGLEQRGGVSLSYLQLSDQPIAYPKFNEADVMLIMSEQARRRTNDNKAKVLIDYALYKEKPEFKAVSPRNQNIFFLKVLSELMKKSDLIDPTLIYESLLVKFADKTGFEEIKNIVSSS